MMRNMIINNLTFQILRLFLYSEGVKPVMLEHDVIIRDTKNELLIV